MKPIIEIENLSKKFSINHAQEPYLSLRDSFKNIFNRTTKEDFYALKDINFTVEEGDSVGIIGKNGAGKSTLLKIISKITPPTTGCITYRGRVASLLEVGTGFHTELTGRENVFMNGSILGMKRSEIKKNFDAIVDFAGVEKFIDTPLKHYSSGMQLRLAFAVAAFLENEILIIDEVLAVGDAEFQQKCLGKMKDVTSEGRTVIFVSHDMDSILSLCKTGILLNKGEIQSTGELNPLIQLYTNHFQNSNISWSSDKRPGDEVVKLNKVLIVDSNGNQISNVCIQDKFGVKIEYEVLEDNSSPTPNFHFFTNLGTQCFVSILETKILKKGNYSSILWIPGNLLNNQSYLVGVALTTFKTMQIHLYEREIINIEVVENKISRATDFGGLIPGAVRPHFESETKQI